MFRRLSLATAACLALMLIGSACASSTRLDSAGSTQATPTAAVVADDATSEPTQSPAPPPTATATAAPETDPSIDWDAAIKDHPYTPVEHLQAMGLDWDPLSGASSRSFTTLAEGRLFDGDYVPDYPPGAHTWTERSDIDPAAGYAYVASDGVAEPGDQGCYEIVESDGVVYQRATFEPGSDEFVAGSEPGSLLDDFGPDAAEELYELRLWDRLEATPDVIELTAGWLREYGELGEDDVQLAVDRLGGQAAVNNFYNYGALEVIVDAAGLPRSYTLWARHVGEPRELSGGITSQRDWTLYVHNALGPLDPEALRVTPDMSLLEAGYCRSPIAGIAGRWRLGSLIAGDELPISLLEQIPGAYVEIGADGSLAGSFGCRRFEGTASLGFRTLEDIEITVDGERCVDGQFDEGDIEELIASLFTNGVLGAAIDLEDRLFLVGGAEGEGLAAVYVRQG